MPDRRDIGKLQAEIEELFSDLWQVPRFTGARRGFRPAVDCYRTENPPALTIVVELAGVDPDTVKVVADERALVVSGARRRPEAVQGRVYQQIEIEYGPFQRHIPLAAAIESSSGRYGTRPMMRPNRFWTLRVSASTSGVSGTTSGTSSKRATR